MAPTSFLRLALPIKSLEKLSSGTAPLFLSSKRCFSLSSSRKMKIVQFTQAKNPNEVRVGYVVNDIVVDLNATEPTLAKTFLDILKNDQIDLVKKAVLSSNAVKLPLANVTLKAPITGMDKVLCIGLNYADHCQEQNLTPPAVPMFFSKFSSCVAGPNDLVKLRTDVTKKVDWEVELVAVIGKTASNVPEDKVWDYIFGYTVGQDISARDWQKEKNGGQFLLGKAMDTFAPIGPWVVSADEVGNPEDLVIQCSVNGELKQNSNTNQLIHKIPKALARLTSVMTLYPGDIIFTGTPGGVGMYANPPQYLKPGDCVTSVIQNVGELVTKIGSF